MTTDYYRLEISIMTQLYNQLRKATWNKITYNSNFTIKTTFCNDRRSMPSRSDHGNDFTELLPVPSDVLMTKFKVTFTYIFSKKVYSLWLIPPCLGEWHCMLGGWVGR